MTGRIGNYHWAEVDGQLLDLREVVQGLAGDLLGLTAVNISWDSGVLQELSPIPTGWVVTKGHAVSPPLNHEVLATWPQSACQGGRYDEWYFWRTEPPTLELAPFCNWAGMSLSRAEDLAFPGGFDLAAQLALADPEVVIGRGSFVFVMSKREESARRLLEIAHAA